MTSKDILDFWFSECTPADWWKKSTSFDAKILERFSGIYQAAVKGELYTWREETTGRLTEIIIIDQFARNMYRDQPGAFAFDGIAVVLSQEAIRLKVDNDMNANEKAFLYMPLMHSESLAVHELALQVFDQPGLENNLDFEKKHKAIIDRFGRYPHRNEILGRESTPEEIAFLSTPGSSF